MSDTAICPRCKGIGQKVKRVTYRPNGTVSSIIYDSKGGCDPCRGTGAISEKETKPCS
jgi:DnaJ-class molecular chaperone